MDGAVTKETKKMDGAVTKETKKKRVRVWTDEEKQKNRESKRKRYFLTRMHKGRASALLKSFREFEESGNHILALDFLERAAFSKNCALAYFLLGRQLFQAATMTELEIALAFSYLKRAAEMGHEQANWTLAWGHWHLFEFETFIKNNTRAAEAAKKGYSAHVAACGKGCRCTSHGPCGCSFEEDRQLTQGIKRRNMILQAKHDNELHGGAGSTEGAVKCTYADIGLGFGLMPFLHVRRPLDFYSQARTGLPLRHGSRIHCLFIGRYDQGLSRNRVFYDGDITGQPFFGGRSYHPWAHWFQNETDRKRVCEYLLTRRRREKRKEEQLQWRQEADEPMQPRGETAHVQLQFQREAADIEMRKESMEWNVALQLRSVYKRNALQSGHSDEIPSHWYFGGF